MNKHRAELSRAFSRRAARQDCELQSSIEGYQRDLSRTIGGITSSQRRLRESMLAYTQHAHRLRTSRLLPPTLDVTELTPRYPRTHRLPAINLDSHQSKAERKALHSVSDLERSHTVPPVRKSADVRNHVKVEVKGETGQSGSWHLPGTLSTQTRPSQAWLDAAADDETVSTMAVQGDESILEDKDAVTVRREAETKRLLRLAIQQLQHMEHAALAQLMDKHKPLPIPRRRKRLKLSNPFAAIPEEDGEHEAHHHWLPQESYRGPTTENKRSSQSQSIKYSVNNVTHQPSIRQRKALTDEDSFKNRRLNMHKPHRKKLRFLKAK